MYDDYEIVYKISNYSYKMSSETLNVFDWVTNFHESH